MLLRAGHISMQFKDTNKQHTYDIEKLFDRAQRRNLAWLTGTEAGPGSGNTPKELLRVAEKSGYRAWVPSVQDNGPGKYSDCWIMVRDDFIRGGWKPRYIQSIPGSNALYKKHNIKARYPAWGPKGLVTTRFLAAPEIGEINLGVAHHLARSRKNNKSSVDHGINRYKLNEDLDRTITRWMIASGRGTGLSFFACDRNALDTSNQQINFGTTLADELKRWQNTGHGSIDWMGSYNRDSRVKGKQFQVFNDKKFRLNTDHYYLEGTYEVRPLKV